MNATVETPTLCADCGQHRLKLTRGLCAKCWRKHRDNNTLDNWTTRRPAIRQQPADTEWQQHAACRTGIDPELFHNPHNDRHGKREIYRSDVVECCQRCPVRNECLAYALTDPSLTGYWGGTSYENRQKLRQQAGRGAVA